MAFTEIFIRRPILATVTSLLILLTGTAALYNLPVRQYPELTNTAIVINTAYPGADSQLVQGVVTAPLQQAVASAEGIDTIVSSSTQNLSRIRLNLRLNANPDRAMTDVLSKVNEVLGVLPPEAGHPKVTKLSGDGMALMYIGFRSEVMTASNITDYLTRVIQPRLQTIDGVAEAQILGGRSLAMRVWLDPVRMAALNVTPADVASALKANNFFSAAGQIRGEFVEATIAADTAARDVSAFTELVVKADNGGAVARLGDVADVELGPASADSSSVFGGLEAVFVGIQASPTANPLSVIARVRSELRSIEDQLPPMLEAAIAYDATEFINDSIDEVIRTIGEASLIVIVIIFLFLGCARSTIIPVVTIPLSLIGIMLILLAFGFSINLLTLLALVLAIGVVVDDAIVVVENIYRHVEDGMAPFDAAIKGAREITVPVIGMSLTLAAVYAPIGFMGGLTGTLFQEFAFTLAGAVIVSGIVALTLSPMMCSRLLKSRTRDDRLFHAVDSYFRRLRASYEQRLRRSLEHRSSIIVILLAVVAGCPILYLGAQKELAPTEDQGVVFTIVTSPQYASLDYMEHYTRQMGELFQSFPEYKTHFIINGFEGVNRTLGGLILRKPEDRERPTQAVLAELRTRIASIPGIEVLAGQRSPLPGAGEDPPLEFVITTAGDYEQLVEVAENFKAKIDQSGMLIYSDLDLAFDKPLFRLNIHQDKANQLGLSMRDIGTALGILLGGRSDNRFNLDGRAYEVITQVPREYRYTSEWLNRYHVRTGSGTMVPLSTVATVERAGQPNALTTFQQRHSATLSGVPFPGQTLGDVISFIEAMAAESLPEGYSYDFGGESRQYVQEQGSLVVTFGFALIVIFLVLAAQYESFRDPFIILIALPTSVFGALFPISMIPLLSSINIYTQIGLLTLIALIAKHGILMVDFANRLQRENGLSKHDAIIKAAGVRLRAILMTTAALVVAMVPLLIAGGAGAKSRFDIGLVIAVGMVVGTLFTLFVTPAVYTYVARDHRAERQRRDATGCEESLHIQPANNVVRIRARS